MIYWMDFAIEETANGKLGAFLVCDSTNEKTAGSQSQDEAAGRIQETRQVQRPARMVGLNSLESTLNDTDVDSSSRSIELRAGGRDV